MTRKSFWCSLLKAVPNLLFLLGGASVHGTILSGSLTPNISHISRPKTHKIYLTDIWLINWYRPSLKLQSESEQSGPQISKQYSVIGISKCNVIAEFLIVIPYTTCYRKSNQITVKRYLVMHYCSMCFECFESVFYIFSPSPKKFRLINHFCKTLNIQSNYNLYY